MLNDLKQKPKNKITREDIAALLKSIDKPNNKKRQKTEAVRELGLVNSQGVNVADTIVEYEEF